MREEECFMEEGQDPCQPTRKGVGGRLILMTRHMPTSQIVYLLIIILLKQEPFFMVEISNERKKMNQKVNDKRDGHLRHTSRPCLASSTNFN